MLFKLLHTYNAPYICLTNLNNRRETFDHVARWLKAAMEVAPASLTTILIGNKCDMSDRRTVSYEEGESFAKSPRRMGSSLWNHQQKLLTMWRR